MEDKPLDIRNLPQDEKVVIANKLLYALENSAFFKVDLSVDLELAARKKWNQVSIESGSVREILREIGLMGAGTMDLHIPSYKDIGQIAAEVVLPQMRRNRRANQAQLRM